MQSREIGESSAGKIGQLHLKWGDYYAFFMIMYNLFSMGHKKYSYLVYRCLLPFCFVVCEEQMRRVFLSWFIRAHFGAMWTGMWEQNHTGTVEQMKYDTNLIIIRSIFFRFFPPLIRLKVVFLFVWEHNKLLSWLVSIHNRFLSLFYWKYF